MIKQLRLKFICVNMVLITVMMLVIFGLVIHFTGASLEAESLRMMRSVATGPFELDRPSRDETRLPYFTIQINHWGQLKVTNSGNFDLSDDALVEQIMDVALNSEEESGILADYNLRYYRSVGALGQTVVFADMSSEQATLQNLTYSCILIGAIVFVAFLGVSFWLSGWATKPVAQAWNEQRQFVADASHELKTPLTVIMTNAEMLQNPSYDSQQRAQFSHSILTMSQQMRTLVEGLLELARVDNGAVQGAFVQLDFSELVEDTLLPFEPVYFEQGLTLESRISPDIPVNGSPPHLRQLISILLDNAMKYSTPGGTIRVTLHKQGNHALLSVVNPGPAIPREDLQNIFKRFYRVDKARRRDGSYGLGLAIAEGIVQAHGGRIWAQSQDGLNTFSIQLPTA